MRSFVTAVIAGIAILFIMNCRPSSARLIWEGSADSQQPYYVNLFQSKYPPFNNQVINKEFHRTYRLSSRAGILSRWWLPGEDLQHGDHTGLAGRGSELSENNAASYVAPIGTKVKVIDIETGTFVYVTIANHECHEPGRLINLSAASFKVLFNNSKRNVEIVRMCW